MIDVHPGIETIVPAPDKIYNKVDPEAAHRIAVAATGCEHSAKSNFAYVLRDVEIGLDEDAEPVTSAVVERTDPVKRAPKLSAQQRIGMQALDDALTVTGEKKHGALYPQNRRCVSLETWREFCDRHSLSTGESGSAQRKAFHAAKNALQQKEIIRIVDAWVWRCEE